MGIKIDSIGLFENKNKSVKTSLELCGYNVKLRDGRNSDRPV